MRNEGIRVGDLGIPKALGVEDAGEEGREDKTQSH